MTDSMPIWVGISGPMSMFSQENVKVGKRHWFTSGKSSKLYIYMVLASPSVMVSSVKTNTVALKAVEGFYAFLLWVHSSQESPPGSECAVQGWIGLGYAE